MTTWTWAQWDTRPCLVVYRYKGEGKADGQMSGRHWDGLSSVSPEHMSLYLSSNSIFNRILILMMNKIE